MTTSRRPAPQAATGFAPAFVLHQGSRATRCRHCHHPIRRYREVGWVDTTPAFYGGCYDMCTAVLSGQHEPVWPPRRRGSARCLVRDASVDQPFLNDR